MENVRLMKSYVWHDAKCFFVSTIDRDSSSMLGPERYAETIVWEFDWDKNERGDIVSMHGDRQGSIATHTKVCHLLHETGLSEPPETD